MADGMKIEDGVTRLATAHWHFPALSGQGSLNKRSMPRAENVSRSVNVAVMPRATLANPLSYYETFSTFRAADYSAVGTGLRRKPFVSLNKRSSVRNRFVAELESEGRPACIQDGLRHAGFGEARGVYIANNNQVKLKNDLSRQLMMEIASRVGYPRVSLGGLSLLARPLGRCACRFERRNVARVLNPHAIGQRHEVFQTQVNSDTASRLPHRGIRHFDRYINIPAPTRILTEAATISNGRPVRQLSGFEYTKQLSVDDKTVVALAPNIFRLKGNPPKRLSPAIPQERKPLLLAATSVLAANSVDAGGADSKLSARSASELHQVKRRWPALSPRRGVPLRIVAIVPNVIHRARSLVKQASQVLNAVAERQNHRRILSAHNAWGNQ